MTTAAGGPLARQLVELIRLPSQNPGDGETQVAACVAERCRQLGLEVATPEALPGRPNVVAWLRGRERRPVVALNTHLDTVPISDGWTVDPFGGEIRDERVWGIGAGDAKGQIVAMLGAIEELVRAGTPIRGDLVFTAVADEELGSLGARAVVKGLSRTRDRRAGTGVDGQAGLSGSTRWSASGSTAWSSRWRPATSMAWPRSRAPSTPAHGRREPLLAGGRHDAIRLGAWLLPREAGEGGGLHRARQLIALAEAAWLGYVVGQMNEGMLATAAAAHLALASAPKYTELYGTEASWPTRRRATSTSRAPSWCRGAGARRRAG